MYIKCFKEPYSRYKELEHGDSSTRWSDHDEDREFSRHRHRSRSERDRDKERDRDRDRDRERSDIILLILCLQHIKLPILVFLWNFR